MRSVLPMSATFKDFRNAYSNGATPADTVRETFAKIRALNDPAVFITLRDEAALIAEADALHARHAEKLPLYGLPVAVKDNIDVAGLPTTAACSEFTYTPQQDAVAVARLRAAGALVIGKTNLDQFATGLVGMRSPYGAPRNVIDPALVPGGSSSGSAVAVASGIVPFALGTDTAGSGRVPAGLNNIVGLKPSLGAVSSRGTVPACRTLDTISVFAHSVADAWAAYAVIASYDAADPYSRPFAFTRAAVPSPLRLGVPDSVSRKFGGDELSERAFDEMVEKARALGATIVPIDLTSFYATAALLYDGPWVAERYQGIRNFIEQHPEAMHPVTRMITLGAAKFSAADTFAGTYRLAELKRATLPVWSLIDALLVPTFPRPRTRADVKADPLGPNAELGTYTNFVNLLDLAAIAVPGVPRADGWPAGITLIGPAGKDAMLAAFGSELHHGKETQFFSDVATSPSKDTELAVVGAHLSGLPLNHELTSLGGRLLRAVSTQKDYQFYALSGGPPHRPGLLRVAPGQGHAIATEVWSLPPESFARFVAAIPEPLGIGTLFLADGTRPKGFLVEAEAVRDASDISGFGGWRAYLAEKAKA